MKNTVFRTQTRGYSYLFFKTVEELDEVLESLPNRYDIECIEFPVADTFDLRAQNAPLPEWRRIYNGKWQTESEIEQLKAESINPE
ncbi:hypothetical protein LRP52_21585 [Photobacterium sp. ZSDE20]|nr:hypothetical protein [Photobacterium sp. ZSDE20]